MMGLAGHRIGLRLAILDPGGSTSPAGQVSELSIEGSFRDSNKIQELANISDIITTEIEHIDCNALEILENNGHIVQPHSSTFRIIQNKYNQKVHLSKYSIPLPEYCEIISLDDCYKAGQLYGYPYVLKNCCLAYDGRGNCVVQSEANIEESYHKLGGNTQALYAEKFVPFIKELAVMVVRSKGTDTEDLVTCYPVVETIQTDNICDIVICPAQISSSVSEKALNIAKNAISTLSGWGIFGVEMFLLSNGEILLNEIAPRPHNSGHYTIEACEIDQFEMHLRAVSGLPCPTPRLRVNYAMMINIIGKGSNDETLKILNTAYSVPGASIHWYGKIDCRLGRKMAHITVTASSINELISRVDLLGVERSKHNLQLVNDDTSKVSELKSSEQVLVGIIMGSDSDLPTMKDAAGILDKFKIPYEITIVSAHRTPNRMYAYAQSAVERGIKVIIAGAGGAAHLPGMVASLTSLPVIGVPIKTSILSGNDSLLSIVQMPKGIPVATVAIDNATNAGLLAVRILGVQNFEILKEMEGFLNEQEEEVLRKAVKLETIGVNQYLQEMKK